MVQISQTKNDGWLIATNFVEQISKTNVVTKPNKGLLFANFGSQFILLIWQIFLTARSMYSTVYGHL